MREIRQYGSGKGNQTRWEVDQGTRTWTKGISNPIGDLTKDKQDWQWQGSVKTKKFYGNCQAESELMHRIRKKGR